jgi:hypothetical protein
MMIANPDAKLARDLVVLGRFIRIYCDGNHADQPREAVQLKFCDVERLLGESPALCEDCNRLLAHAFVKRSRCPLDPKPACKHCPQHCYHPDYRRKIQEVMRFAGWRMISRGRVDLLWHFLF